VASKARTAAETAAATVPAGGLIAPLTVPQSGVSAVSAMSTEPPLDAIAAYAAAADARADTLAAQALAAAKAAEATNLMKKRMARSQDLIATASLTAAADLGFSPRAALSLSNTFDAEKIDAATIRVSDRSVIDL
jgi:hypothetical protein